MDETKKSPVAPLIDKLKDHSLKVCCIGAGYVGSIFSITLAHFNPKISIDCVDINKDLIQKWIEGRLPFFEPQLDEYYKIVMEQHKNLTWTTDSLNSMKSADVIFVCVNTYSKPVTTLASSYGVELDMGSFNAVIKAISKSADINKHKILVEKSTVPVGTHKIVENMLNEELKDDFSKYFTIVDMPEFLAEGTAIKNLLNPDRIVIGSNHDAAGIDAFNVLEQLCKPFPEVKVLNPNVASSELCKLFSNAMLAQRISSVNSLTNLCEIYGASIQEVTGCVGQDQRIGKQFLQASLGFGGSCFEKDVRCLIYILETQRLISQAQYWEGVIKQNDHQKLRLAEMIHQNHTLPVEKNITLFGYAFKKNTSDARMTPVATLIDYLTKNGFFVHIHDPQSTHENFLAEQAAQGKPISTDSYKYWGPDYKSAVHDSSSIIIGTEWDEFLAYDYKELRQIMRKDRATLYDLRSYTNTEKMKEAGFDFVFKLGN